MCGESFITSRQRYVWHQCHDPETCKTKRASSRFDGQCLPPVRLLAMAATLRTSNFSATVEMLWGCRPPASWARNMPAQERISYQKAPFPVDLSSPSVQLLFCSQIVIVCMPSLKKLADRTAFRRQWKPSSAIPVSNAVPFTKSQKVIEFLWSSHYKDLSMVFGFNLCVNLITPVKSRPMHVTLLQVASVSPFSPVAMAMSIKFFSNFSSKHQLGIIYLYNQNTKTALADSELNDIFFVSRNEK